MSEENKNIFDDNTNDSVDKNNINENDTVYFSSEPTEAIENFEKSNDSKE